VDAFSYTLLYNPNSSAAVYRTVGFHVAVTSDHSCLLQCVTLSIHLCLTATTSCKLLPRDDGPVYHCSAS
jgi:hypothetical protein